MKSLNWVHFAVLVAALIVVPKAMAEPPIVHQSTESGTPAVLGENTAEGGAGVFGRANAKGAGGVIGHANDGRGVYGESKSGAGVWGFSESGPAIVGESKGVVGVKGQADKGRGVYGESKTGQGVWGFSESSNAIVGDSRSANAATAVFQNTGGGDLIEAGKNGVFRVLNNGDVLVRGQKIGAAGVQGLQGPKGDPGPAVKTVALCQSPEFGAGSCPCTNRTVTRVSAQCTVTSDTGSCSNAIASGCCAVCSP